MDGEECARITGEVAGWESKDKAPTCTLETLYSLARGVPVRGSHAYVSASRTTKIEVKVGVPKE